MKRNIFNKKIFMSIVCLLFVAIIPLCSINLYNYSQALLSTSQEDTLDEENDEAVDDDKDDANTDNETEDNEDVTTTASGYWTDYVTDEDAPDRGTDRIYKITNAEQLAWMAIQEDIVSTFSLEANIDLSAHYWIPIENFRGVFKGNGYTITGLYMNITDDNSATGSYYRGERYRGEHIGLFGNINAYGSNHR